MDRVVIGDPTSEKDHRLEGERTFTGPGAYGQEMSTRWRDARDGGWFSYRVKPGNGAGGFVLRLTFWGRERGARTFDVLVDGQKVATMSLGDTGKDEFIHKEIEVAAKMAAGREFLTVKLQAHSGNTAGGLFDLRLLGR